MSTPAIETIDLTRTYAVRRQRQPGESAAAARELRALDGVSLQVRPGELFGLLGTNGAGKTTLIKILTTLLTPTAGQARVDGLDVVAQAAAIRPRINMVSGGESSGYGLLTIRENLWLFTQLYGIPGRLARQRIDHMLQVVGLTDRADTKVSHLSTGLRQKMNFCRGFVTDPRILFLDEPTLGLDVNASRVIRSFLRSWLAERPERTLLLTTHYMMEADELCDRVAILSHGKVLACDTPAALKRSLQQQSLFEIALAPRPDSLGADYHELAQLPGVVRCVVEENGDGVVVKAALQEEAVIGPLVQEIVRRRGHIQNLRKIEPTLEEVFIRLTGHGLAEEEKEL